MFFSDGQTWTYWFVTTALPYVVIVALMVCIIHGIFTYRGDK